MSQRQGPTTVATPKQRDFQRARRIEGGQMIAATRKNWKRSDRRRKTKAQRVARRANRSPR